MACYEGWCTVISMVEFVQIFIKLYSVYQMISGPNDEFGLHKELY